MSKIIEILQAIVDEKQAQLDEVLVEGYAGSAKEKSEAREALLRDQLQLELRLEEEGKNRQVPLNPGNGEPQTNPLDRVKSRFERLKPSIEKSSNDENRRRNFGPILPTKLDLSDRIANNLCIEDGRCTRNYGHTGPCAVVIDEDSIKESKDGK